MNASKGKSARFSILVASDWAPIRAFDSLMRDDPESIYGEILPALRAADLRIVNCECALTNCSSPVWKSGSVFKGTPKHVMGLAMVPFDAACMANNHVLDFGVPGLRESLNVLHRNGIRTVGAGLTEEQACRPLKLTVKSHPVHIINFSEGEDLTSARGGPGVFGWDVPRVQSLIRRCKSEGGLVVAICHCGLEYIPYPPPYVVAAFRSLIEAGADCVVGHHPHVPQGLEWHQGRPIFYSLGNFVFYQHTDLYYRKTGFCIALHCTGDRVACMELHPYRITEKGLRRLDAGEEASFRRTIDRISRPLSVRAGPEKAWQAYLAYYGLQGFTTEVLSILEKMKSEPPKGAAMFRNRLTTLQHSELWRDFLTRIMAGEKPRCSGEAKKIITEWFMRRVKP